MSNSSVTAETFHRMITDGENLLILDVRSSAEFASGHIEGSVSMPLDLLDSGSLRAAAADKETSVLVCLHGTRAAQARKVLAGAGAGDLTILEGGITAWKQSGFPVVGTAGGGLRLVPRLAFGLFSLVALALGARVDPVFYGLAVFASFGAIAGGMPCCIGRGGCGGGCSCER